MKSFPRNEVARTVEGERRSESYRQDNQGMLPLEPVFLQAGQESPTAEEPMSTFEMRFPYLCLTHNLPLRQA